MDVMKSANGAGLQTVNDTQLRDQQAQNAVNQFQARYGEKPKETRVIKKALDKDDFMRIMVTEMKHQDPTKPMDSDRMATQMAQVTSVEQLKNVGTAIEKLADKNSATDRLAMSAMIGKQITVDKGRFTHQKGTLSPINFDLTHDAQKIKLSVLNEKGDEVAVRELEPMKAGANSYNWDGINSSKIESLSGTYNVRIDAEDAQGNPIKIDPISKETVVGVTFEGGETNFLVGDAKNPQRVAFKNVSRIEGDSQTRASAMQMRDDRTSGFRSEQAKTAGVANPGSMAGAAAGANAGTGDMSAAGLPPGLQDKLKAEMASRAKAQDAVDGAAKKSSEVAEESSAKPEAAVKPEGFPNGLGD